MGGGMELRGRIKAVDKVNEDTEKDRWALITIRVEVDRVEVDQLKSLKLVSRVYKIVTQKGSHNATVSRFGECLYPSSRRRPVVRKSAQKNEHDAGLTTNKT